MRTWPRRGENRAEAREESRRGALGEALQERQRVVQRAHRWVGAAAPPRVGPQGHPPSGEEAGRAREGRRARRPEAPLERAPEAPPASEEEQDPPPEAPPASEEERARRPAAPQASEVRRARRPEAQGESAQRGPEESRWGVRVALAARADFLHRSPVTGSFSRWHAVNTARLSEWPVPGATVSFREPTRRRRTLHASLRVRRGTAAPWGKPQATA